MIQLRWRNNRRFLWTKIAYHWITEARSLVSLRLTDEPICNMGLAWDLCFVFKFSLCTFIVFDNLLHQSILIHSHTSGIHHSHTSGILIIFSWIFYSIILFYLLKTVQNMRRIQRIHDEDVFHVCNSQHY